MKRTLLIVIMVMVSLTVFGQISKKALTVNKTTTGKEIKLIAPVDNWKFDKIPAQINFKWERPGTVKIFTFYMEYMDNGKWILETKKENLKVLSILYTYRKNKPFRWKVTTEYMNRVIYESKWRHGHYAAGNGIQQNANNSASVHPVPVSPTNNALLTNHPRNMTFKWLHSTKPQFRNYEIQVDILHARSRKWRSQIRGESYLLEDTTKLNHYNFEFTADRKGRWRVRGFNNAGQYTPWSAWQHFEYNARH